jgi:hypothetical protein
MGHNGPDQFSRAKVSNSLARSLVIARKQSLDDTCAIVPPSGS